MLRRRLIFWPAILAIATISILDHAGAFGYRANDRSRYDGAMATVTQVIDGGTIEVDIPDEDRAVTRIRLRGINAPPPANPSDGSRGDAAADYLRANLLGRSVRILLDPNRESRDASGDLLAYVYEHESNESVNDRLIARGLAHADANAEHVFKLAFAQKEQTARKRKLGIWADRSE